MITITGIRTYQVIVLDELARHGVTVLFHDAPPFADDPQAQLLTQVQGVIAKYERAKIAERYRRGKLWRARAGEVIAWKIVKVIGVSHAAPTEPRTSRSTSPKGRSCDASFGDYVENNLSMRQITWQLNQDLNPFAKREGRLGVSTIGRLIRNEAYVGRAYYNRTAAVSGRHPGKGARQSTAPS